MILHAFNGILLAASLAMPQQDLKPTNGVASTTAMSYSGRNGNLDVAVPRIEDPDISLDGRLDDAAWRQAARVLDFTQYEPVEGIASTEDTEIRVFYSSDAIYFGIRAYDRNPDLVLARLGERDRSVFGDDWVRIMLDTFDDQRQAYVFYVNPLGIQTDGLWIEGMQGRRGGGFGGGVSIDFNPDFIWESNGRVDEQGWSAEVKIPYVSLRFREVPVQQWGFNVTREVKRRGFKQAWAPLSTNISSTLAQSGRLVGLRDLQPRRLVQINPEATGSRRGSVNSESGRFGHDAFDPDFGVNGRIGVTQNLALDATVNPDFSQIEADANRLTVNERFAIFFPEKRPFFLDGAEIFRSPRNLVHTRQIEDPSGGAKLTGKIGSFNIGYLGALDESPKTLYDGDRAAMFNLLRVRRDVGRGSTVGLLYTDRMLTDRSTYNRVAAADLRFLLGGSYTVTGQFAGAWTGSPETGGSGMKPLGYLRVAKSGRTFSWNAEFEDVHPDFTSEAGFINRVGDVKTNGAVTFTKFGRPGAIVERLNLTFNGEGFFDHGEFWRGSTPYEAEVQMMPTVSFMGGRSVTFILRNGYFRFQPEDYALHQIQDASGSPSDFVLPKSLKNMWAFVIFPRARVTNQIETNGRLFLRETPIFLEADRGFEVQVGGEITVRPNATLQVRLGHTFSQLDRSDNTMYSRVHLPRFRVQYQFSKSLFVRGLMQYEFQQRSALRDPTTGQPILIGGAPVGAVDAGEFEGQFLLQYQPSPGTIFFVGYSRLMEGDRSFRLGRMDPTADGLFVKLSYLFRM